MEPKTYKLVTHNRDFHIDDIFACAILFKILRKEGAAYTLTRTRDEQLIAEADIVFDVGGIYDPATKRYDHHQKGGAGKRANGVEYASCGLLWKELGVILAGDQDLADRIDHKLLQPIDMEDNGVSTYTPTGDVSPYTLRSALYAFRTTWKEEEAELDARFLEMVAFAEKILDREIINARDNRDAESIALAAYNNAEDKRIIVMEINAPAEDVLKEFPEPLFIVRPNTDGSWRMVGVGTGTNLFERRKDMPQAWAGLRDAELDAATGVTGTIFCHNGRWLIIAKTKEAILKLAKLAVEA